MSGVGQVARQGVVYGLSGAATRIVAFLMLPLYTRLLTAAEYGAIDLLLSLNLVVNAFAYLGTDSSFAYVFSQLPEGVERRSLFRVAVTSHLSLGLAVASLALAGFPLVNTWFGDGELRPIWMALALAANLASVFLNDLKDVLRLEFRAWSFLRLNVALGVLVPLGIVACVLWLRAGVSGYFLGALAGALLTCLYIGWHARDLLWGPWRTDLARKLFASGFGLLPSGLAVLITSVADRWFINRFGTVADVGVFGIASRIGAPTVLVAEAFFHSWWPIAVSKHDPKERPELYRETALAYLAGGLGLVALLGAAARPALMILVPPAYQDAHRAVGLIALGQILYGYYWVTSLGIWWSGRHQLLTVAKGTAALLSVAGSMLLVPVLGFIGAPLSGAVALFCGNAIATVLGERLEPYGLPKARFACAVALTGAALYVQTWAQAAAGPHLREAILAAILTGPPAAMAIAASLVPPWRWKKALKSLISPAPAEPDPARPAGA